MKKFFGLAVLGALSTLQAADQVVEAPTFSAQEAGARLIEMNNNWERSEDDEAIYFSGCINAARRFQAEGMEGRFPVAQYQLGVDQAAWQDFTKHYLSFNGAAIAGVITVYEDVMDVGEMPGEINNDQLSQQLEALEHGDYEDLAGHCAMMSEDLTAMINLPQLQATQAPGAEDVRLIDLMDYFEEHDILDPVANCLYFLRDNNLVLNGHPVNQLPYLNGVIRVGEDALGNTYGVHEPNLEVAGANALEEDIDMEAGVAEIEMGLPLLTI